MAVIDFAQQNVDNKKPSIHIWPNRWFRCRLFWRPPTFAPTFAKADSQGLDDLTVTGLPLLCRLEQRSDLVALFRLEAQASAMNNVRSTWKR